MATAKWIGYSKTVMKPIMKPIMKHHETHHETSKKYHAVHPENGQK